MLGGPGTNVGISVNGTSHTVTGIPQGTHTWTVATNYATGGILTTPDKWSKVTTSVSNGLITVNLLEPGGVDAIKGGFNGSYEMYVRVERLPQKGGILLSPARFASV